MNELFETLCGDLRGEIERQETVLAVCRAQIDAVGTRDLSALEARTAALDILVREAAHAQAARRRTINKVAAQLDLHANEHNLEGLIGVAPAPWNDRLRDIQGLLRRAVSETRRVVRLNARAIRRSLEFNQRLLSCITLGPVPQAVYGVRGGWPRMADAPALIDQRG